MTDERVVDKTATDETADDEEQGAPRLHIAIDRDLCMGSGNCMYWAPSAFDLDDDGIAIVVGRPNVDDERVLLAVEHCPTNAISIAEV